MSALDNNAFDVTIIFQVAAKKQTLKNVTDYITDVICKRSKFGYNYGVILIPEGLIDFIPEVPPCFFRGLLSYLHVLTLSTFCVIILFHNWFSSPLSFQVQKLIAELNEILAHDTVDEAGIWKNKLEPESKELFEFLPPAIQEQLMLERDPHGNVQVSYLCNLT